MNPHNVYHVKKGEIIGMPWMESHPNIDMVHGLAWDYEKEIEVHSTVINPWGRYGYYGREKKQ